MESRYSKTVVHWFYTAATMFLFCILASAAGFVSNIPLLSTLGAWMLPLAAMAAYLWLDQATRERQG